MSTPSSPETLVTEQERKLIFRTADRLNEAFQRGTYIWNKGVLRLLRRLPRPILVDFDHTLADRISFREYDTPDKDFDITYPNPEAIGPLKALTDIGTVFVVTGAARSRHSWGHRREELEKFGMWHPGMILINGVSLSMNTERGWDKRRIEKRGISITEFAQPRGINTDNYPERLWSPKSLAPAFNKPYDIPLIDDDHYFAKDVPGILGLVVRHFEHQPERNGSIGLTLPQAAEQAIAHYRNLV